MTRVLSIAVIFLALIVAGREIPEISKLADDTSNDGQIVDVTVEAVPSPVSQRASVTSAPVASGTLVALFPRGDVSPHSMRGVNRHDLLLFLTIQRT